MPKRISFLLKNSIHNLLGFCSTLRAWKYTCQHLFCLKQILGVFQQSFWFFQFLHHIWRPHIYLVRQLSSLQWYLLFHGYNENLPCPWKENHRWRLSSIQRKAHHWKLEYYVPVLEDLKKFEGLVIWKGIVCHNIIRPNT